MTTFATSRFISHGLRFALAAALVAALSSSGVDASNLKELDTRPDGSRVLNMVVHEIPRAVPAFGFVDGAGNHHGLKEFRSKIVVLHFWATWCIPCRAELLTVNALQGELGGEEITFVPLSIDRDGAALVRQYYDDHGIEHLNVYIDEGMDAAQAMLVNGIPYTILIDREGREMARILGDRNWIAPDAVALMRRLVE